MTSEALEQETALVEQAKTDERAFWELYETHKKELYRYAYYRTGKREDAEDVVAQTFLRAWRGLPGYRWVGAPFRNWLYRIAANVIASRRTRPERPVAEVCRASPLEAVDDRVDLAENLRALPETQQQVLVLRYVQDLSVRDVAQMMRRSENAVRQLAFRALETLRGRMSPNA